MSVTPTCSAANSSCYLCSREGPPQATGIEYSVEIEIRNELDFCSVTFSCSTFLWNIVLAFVVILVRVSLVFTSHGSSPVNSISVDCEWGGVKLPSWNWERT